MIYVKNVIKRWCSQTKGLWVVPLPIGNWEDLTPSNYQILSKAQIIICEDTRVTGNMFKTLR